MNNDKPKRNKKPSNGSVYPKYPFRDMEIGEVCVVSENYSRITMTKISNAARNWSKRVGAIHKFSFKKSGNQILATRIR